MKILVAIIILISFHNGVSKFELKREEALSFCKKNNLDTKYCILIDMSIHSGKKRYNPKLGKSKKDIPSCLEDVPIERQHQIYLSSPESGTIFNFYTLGQSRPTAGKA